MVTAFAILAMF